MLVAEMLFEVLSPLSATTMTRSHSLLSVLFRTAFFIAGSIVNTSFVLQEKLSIYAAKVRRFSTAYPALTTTVNEQSIFDCVHLLMSVFCLLSTYFVQ